MSSKIIIPEEMKVNYLTRRKNDLTACHQALIDSNFELLANLGHQIQGNAITFGFAELGEIATDMELMAIKKDVSSLKKILIRFESFLMDQNF